MEYRQQEILLIDVMRVQKKCRYRCRNALMFKVKRNLEGSYFHITFEICFTHRKTFDMEGL